MDDDRVRRIVEACIEAHDDGRPVDLGELCEHDPVLEERVRKLLEFEPLATSLIGVTHESTDEPPRQLGPYVVKGRLGAGGMGQVLLAEEPGLGRELALKVLPSGSLQSARFRREAAIAAALDHPNIVPIYGVGEDRGFTYIAMKKLSGPGLEALKAPLSTREAASIGAAVARALQFAHEAGVVHRDVKPANIVLDRGIPHLVDFGLARSTSFETMTAEGHILGTLPYMAPERLQNSEAEAGVGADIYGLGASLHECVTGRPCFSAREREALLEQILLREAPLLRLEGADRGFEAIVLRALQKDPRHRFASAGQMADELEAWLAGRPISSRRDGVLTRAWRRIRRHPRAALVASVSVLLAIALGVALWDREAQRRHTLDERIGRIRNQLREDQPIAAQEALAALASETESPGEFADVTREVDAALAMEGLLDSLVGDGPPIGSGPQFVASSMHELMQRVERTRDDYGDSLLATLALASAAWKLHDSEHALQYVAEIEAQHGPMRATRALKTAMEGDASWKPPAIQTDKDADHLFTAMVMRSLGAPRAEVEKELRAALETSRRLVRYRAGLQVALLRSDQGRYDDALTEVLSIERPVHGGDAVDRLQAHLRVQLGDDDGALASLDRIPSARHRPFDEFVRIRILRKRGDSAGVEAAWSSLLDRWKQSPEALLLKGYFASEAGQTAVALAAFEDAARTGDWYQYHDTAAAEVLQCRLLIAMANREGPDSAAIAAIRKDAAESRFQLPYARSTALYVQSRVAEIEGDTSEAMDRAREAAAAAPENALAALRVAHLVSEEVSAAKPWNGHPLSAELKARSIEGIQSAERVLRLEGRRVSLPRGARARARYYEAILALGDGDADRARNAAAEGLEEDAGTGPEAAAVTEGLRWVARRAAAPAR